MKTTLRAENMKLKLMCSVA